jgi:MFS family permease
MTRVEANAGCDGGFRGVVPPGRPGRVASRNRYLSLLRTPGALAFSASGFVGRMSMSMYGLGTVLLIASLTGRYGLAGTVAAAGSIGFAVLSPYIAQLADRFGQRRVLLTQVAIFAVASVSFIGLTESRAPFGVLLVTGAIAGGFMPSTGNMVRTRWSALLSDDQRRLHAAFALESVNDELIFVIGPALVTLLATQVLPASGIGTAAGLAIIGTTLFALQRRTEPPPKPRPERPTERRGRPSLPAAGLVTLSPAFLFLGAMFVTVDLSSVAFATELGHRPLAGLVLGTYALGSAIGGLWYGSRNWRAPAGRRFITTAALVVAGATSFIFMPNLPALDGACLIAGLSIAPTIIAGYAILERQAQPHRRTEAMAWLGSAISVGVASGSAITGHLLDAYGAKAGYIFGASCGVVGVLICLAGRRKLVVDEARADEARAGEQHDVA